ncbi:hypothetical protein BDP27DRAFT_1079708 [Rhodocollybia butyracea]|uniref:Uncharacterized protein n=1 Tax=Rhodocollybia butyracea TaxID=206335 RepID=A0A9P5PLX6_9AGAR|nr:hypothetical protein BDP27DRAFT_1079708 [Rhodocollybia butyracea]
MQPGPASFFMGSREFTISGGHFTNNAYYGSENWNSDTSKVSIYPRHKFHNWGVVRARKNWTFNSAVMEKEGSGKSMSVFVQTFEGHGVKQLFANTLEFSRQLKWTSPQHHRSISFLRFQKRRTLYHL